MAVPEAGVLNPTADLGSVLDVGPSAVIVPLPAINRDGPRRRLVVAIARRRSRHDHRVGPSGGAGLNGRRRAFEREVPHIAAWSAELVVLPTVCVLA